VSQSNEYHTLPLADAVARDAGLLGTLYVPPPAPVSSMEGGETTMALSTAMTKCTQGRQCQHELPYMLRDKSKVVLQQGVGLGLPLLSGWHEFVEPVITPNDCHDAIRAPS